MSKNKAIVMCFGRGGHQEQARRLLARLKEEPEFAQLSIITCSDGPKPKSVLSDEHYSIGETRDKHSLFKSVANIFPHIFLTLQFIFNVSSRNRVKTFISTGPGLSILPSLIFKVLGVKIVFIESWSKFNTKSLSGKCLYLFADEFIVQNRKLLLIYPNAKYGGRL